MAKFTPGPWELSIRSPVGSGQFYPADVIGAAGKIIASVTNSDLPDEDGPAADARAILKVPEMYAVLREVIDYVEHTWVDVRPLDEVAERIEALLADIDGY